MEQQMQNSMRNFAVFIDMENAGGKRTTLETIIETVKIRGNILIGRVYGYTERYSDLREVLMSNTFSAIPSLRTGNNVKNSMDIQLVVDALDVAFTNSIIDCFCIVSGDSDFVPLVGRLRAMGKHVLGISRSESASNVFINACNEFQFLESMRSKSPEPVINGTDDDEEAQLMRQIESILREQADADGWMLASVLKDILVRLRPDFNQKSYGHNLFGRLLSTLEEKYGTIRCVTDNFNFKVRLAEKGGGVKSEPLTRRNWIQQVQQILDRLKSDGFDRVNPSIIKESLTEKHPDFTERSIGFKKFSDMMKCLEQSGKIMIETDETMNMLVTIL
ncbi:MAG: NYN domain-containing protein [Christensenellales bacterium]